MLDTSVYILGRTLPTRRSTPRSLLAWFSHAAHSLTTPFDVHVQSG